MSATFLKTSIREVECAIFKLKYSCRQSTITYVPCFFTFHESFTVELKHPSNFSGRIRYTFASFWSRNRTFRALEAALQSYEATLEAEKQVLSKCTNFIFGHLLTETNLMFILVRPQTGESTCIATNRK